MSFFELPWLELAILVPLASSAFVSQLRDPGRAFRAALVFTGMALVLAILAWFAFAESAAAGHDRGSNIQSLLFGHDIFSLDELSAPLVPAVALLHFLTALATARTKMRRFSFSWSLAAEGLNLATFACQDRWVLVGLLALATVPPYVELVVHANRARVYVIHMTLFVAMLVLGWWLIERTDGVPERIAWWTTLPLMIAVLVRCGTVPVHCWITDWFEHASLGIAI
ncbi:MAG TPA: oxidoreductase, partial [Pirellulales bacterium]|nr:oxidoreductase [Pirellulales bacterium]